MNDDINVCAIKDSDLQKFAKRIQGRLQAGFKVLWISRSDTAHYMYEALMGYEVPQTPGSVQPAATKGEEMGLVTVEDCIELYNSGYNHGILDAKGGDDRPIAPEDMTIAFGEIVVKLLKEMG